MENMAKKKDKKNRLHYAMLLKDFGSIVRSIQSRLHIRFPSALRCHLNCPWSHPVPR